MKMKKKLIWPAATLALTLAYVASPFLPSVTYKNGYGRKQLGGMLIVGHRGGASLAPENTLTALRKGMEAGADMVEIDIHLTKDGQLLVCHDQTVDRTTNGSGRIDQQTLEELQRLTIVDSEGNLTQEHLPSLDEVLQLMGSERAKGRECRLLIEIKRTRDIYQGIEERLLEKLQEYGAREWSVVQSFNDSVLERIHQLDPSVRLEKLLVCKMAGLPFVVDGTHLTGFSYEKYDYVSSFNFFYRGVSRQLIDDIHAHGKEVKVWTLEGLDAPFLPVDGIITNRPDLWAEARGGI